MKLILIIIIAVAAYFAAAELGYIGGTKKGNAAEKASSSEATEKADADKEKKSEGKNTAKKKKKSTADQVSGYATGYTQMKIKQRGEKKLDTIQKTRNQQLNQQMKDD